MTREEAINHLKTAAKSAIDSGYDSAVVDAVGMATKALEQEPCEDAVSREAVEDIVIWYDEKREMLDEIQKLPSVSSSEKPNKSGSWKKDIDNSRRWDRVRFYCSECGNWQTYGETDYCPSCGARMIKPQESEGKNDN